MAVAIYLPMEPPAQNIATNTDQPQQDRQILNNPFAQKKQPPPFVVTDFPLEFSPPGSERTEPPLGALGELG